MRLLRCACVMALAVALGAEAAPRPLAAPDRVGDGWETAAPAAAGVDDGLISRLIERIAAGAYKPVRSVLVVKDGKLVVEEYFPRTEGDRPERAMRRVALQQQASATKSVTSILVGIAIDQHLIAGVDEKVSTFLPEYADVFADAAKARLRVRDLLTMRSGLTWDEWSRPYSDPLNDHVRMYQSPDLLRYVLERPAAGEPGGAFSYNSGLSILLGHILAKATGMKADKFAERHLFEPLGITDYYWSKVPGELVQTGGGLYLRPRDMAKIGQLFLNGGRWGDKQVVSKAWVAESTKAHVAADQVPAATMSAGYGYCWWLGSFRAGDRVVRWYSARGLGGQFICVFPDDKLVVAITCAIENPLTLLPLEIVRRDVLPAAGVLPAESSP